MDLTNKAVSPFLLISKWFFHFCKTLVLKLSILSHQLEPTLFVILLSFFLIFLIGFKICTKWFFKNAKQGYKCQSLKIPFTLDKYTTKYALISYVVY